MKRSARVIAERVAVAHFVAYPIAFFSAVAAIPLAILYLDRRGQVDAADAGEVGQRVLHAVAWPAGIMFAIVHATVLLWILPRDAAAGQRRFLRGLAALAASVVIFGGGSWVWLFLR